MMLATITGSASPPRAFSILAGEASRPPSQHRNISERSTDIDEADAFRAFKNQQNNLNLLVKKASNGVRPPVASDQPVTKMPQVKHRQAA
jgi:hypothetical protein